MFKGVNNSITNLEWSTRKENKQHRINIETSKNRIYLDMTKRGNYFDLNTDRITINKKDINIDDIKNQLVQYFN